MRKEVLEYIQIQILAIFLLLLSFLFSCSVPRPQNKESFLQLLRESKERTNYLSLMDSIKAGTLATEHVIQGSTYEQKRQYPEAILEFFDALKYDTSATIYYAIAKNYQKLYKLDNALAYAVKAVEKKPDFLYALELMADIHRINMEYDKALIVYEQILSLKPSNKDYYKLHIAFIYEYVDKSKAVELYKELLQGNDDEYIITRLETLYENLGKEEERIVILKDLFLKNPSDPRRALPIMEYYFQRDNYQSALEFLLKLDSTLPEERSEIFFGYFLETMMRDTTERVRTTVPVFLEKMGNRFRFNWRLNLFAGYLADRTGNTLLTDKYFTQALKVADSIADIPIQIGTFYLFEQKYTKSLEILSQYEKEFPDDYRFPFFKGICYTSMDSMQQALVSLRLAMALDDENIEIFSQLGIVFDRIDDKDSSDYYYKKALAIKPDDPLVNNNYAYSLSVRGIMLDEAEEMVSISLEAEPNNASYLDTFGWIHFKKGNYEIALEYILKSIENGGDSAELYEHLGDVYWELGMKNEARSAWKKANEREPDNREILQRLEKTD